MTMMMNGLHPQFAGLSEWRARRQQKAADRAEQKREAQQAYEADQARIRQEEHEREALHLLGLWFANPTSYDRYVLAGHPSIDKLPVPPGSTRQIHELLKTTDSYSTQHGSMRTGSCTSTTYVSGMELLIYALKAGDKGLSFQPVFDAFSGGGRFGSASNIKKLPEAFVRVGLLEKQPRASLSDYGRLDQYRITPKGQEIINLYRLVMGV